MRSMCYTVNPSLWLPVFLMITIRRGVHLSSHGKSCYPGFVTPGFLTPMPAFELMTESCLASVAHTSVVNGGKAASPRSQFIDVSTT